MVHLPPETLSILKIGFKFVYFLSKVQCKDSYEVVKPNTTNTAP